MALVDYSSASESQDEQPTTSDPPAKRRKGSHVDASGNGSGLTPDSALPPLPPAFHDLYASTVRRSVFDDPSLHQGRKRQIPHAVGNWPSHLYIEWHPDTSQHGLLVRLIQQVDKQLNGLQLHSFLTSDLGAPLPLHVSLSRPMALSTATKDAFLDAVSCAVKACGTDVFHVSPASIGWYPSPDSNRTFLILRVASNGEARLNRKLVALLKACNGVAARFDQPLLYHGRDEDDEATAFHVSIGWLFGLPPVDETALHNLLRLASLRQIPGWKIQVSGVKAKIGNIVNHIPLTKGVNTHNSLFDTL